MKKLLLKISVISLLALIIMACATTKSVPHQTLPPDQMSHLQQGKRYFETGYYRSAMRELLPLACDGVAEAQYAVGYMYYYGYGVAQDTEVGRFWIGRAANKGYQPAIKALGFMSFNQRTKGMYPEAPEQKGGLVA